MRLRGIAVIAAALLLVVVLLLTRTSKPVELIEVKDTPPQRRNVDVVPATTRARIRVPKMTVAPAPSDLPVHRKRFLLYKEDGSGYFYQHPLDLTCWIEFVRSNPQGAHAWRAATAPKEGERFAATLNDISCPSRPSVKLQIEFTAIPAGAEVGAEKAVSAKGFVAVGSYSYLDTAKNTHGAKKRLVCFAAEGCATADSLTRGEKPGEVVIHKGAGGAFLRTADGQLWLESNSDERGEWLFRFANAVQIQTPETSFALLLDASRDLWAKIKPVPSPVSAGEEVEYIPSRIFLGNPSKDEDGTFDEDDDDEDDMAVRIRKRQERKKQKKKRANKKIDWSPWNLLAESCDPKLSCRPIRRALDAERKKAKMGPPLHMIFSVDSSKRYEWLALAFQFWWKRTQDYQKGSRFTRLLSAEGAKPDHLMGKVPSFVVDLPPEFKTDRYLPYNKIYSTLAWIQKEHANLPPDQIVVIMDVDIVLIEDLSYIAVDVGKGRPMGAKGFMSFTGEGSLYDKVVDRYCPECQGRADPLAVPYFIHKDDLLELAPKWLEMCRKIRADTTPWESVTDWRKESPIQLSWTAEQWAYLLSASQMGLRHTVREDLSAFTSDSVQDLREPMIHFSDWTVGTGPKGEKLRWNKGETALTVIPNVDPKMGEVNKAMIQALQDARAALYPHLKPDWAEK